MARTIIPVDREAAMTFREFARACCIQLRQWGYSDETIDVYDRTYMQFLAYVKGRGAHDDIRSFNDAMVLGFAEYLGGRGINPNSIIKALSALSTLAKDGMMRRDTNDRRLISEDPTKSFRWPTAQRHETRYLGPAALRKLVDQEAPKYKAIARDLFVETGLRAGEAARLSVEDFREANKRYYLAVKVKGRGQRARKEAREVPLSKGLAEAIGDWLLSRGALHPDAPLLITSEGKRWHRAALSNMIARLAAAAGIGYRVSAHKLRHTANVIARLADVDAPTRSRLLGHSSLRSLERYDHVLPHELHEAREQQSDALHRYLGEPFRAVSEHEGMDRNAARSPEAETPTSDAELRDEGGGHVS